ncbi:MAG: UDP-galactopyranose mutase, partial [Clostridium sp.]|nr:UDP-galactopyranose mutase [Clostridium sp.]
GNIYCEDVNGITVHKYGPHIFHTNNTEVWNFVNRFVCFNRFTLNTIANYRGNLYDLPFNMHTFYQMWNVKTPHEAMSIIERQRKALCTDVPRNLEEQAISLVGSDIYEILIKGYTEKQWGKLCRELPASIIRRIPVRFTFDNNYFSDRYQGVPEGGYNILIDALLKETECRVCCNFTECRPELEDIADKIIYTGPIDEFFDFQLGRLEYRSLRFEQKELPVSSYQGNAIMNYTDADTPYTRIVEHKYFDINNKEALSQHHTVITREYPISGNDNVEPYYPVNDEKNGTLYQEYLVLAEKQAPNTVFSGRLGAYQYLDMDKIIENCFKLYNDYEK